MIALPILAGLLIGMFVNLAADALSRGTPSAEQPVRLVFGPPTCATCGATRPPLAWSGLVATLSGRRRCRSCAAPLPMRHALVEAAAILVLILVWMPLDANREAQAAIADLFASLYAAVLLLVLVTDLERRLVPHAVMLPAIAVAALAAFVNPAWRSPWHALLGGALGLLLGLAFYGGGILFARALGRIRGRTIDEVAFGFGDVTLLTFIGLIVGAPEVILATMIGVFSGGIAALTVLIARRSSSRRAALLTALPYAPFLILGAAVMLAFGQQIMAWYLRGT
jgi:prepilin signal peptidase PulO-like enzyme (type II secretory pathway)